MFLVRAGQILIRRATEGDLQKIPPLHFEAFAGATNTRIGPGYVRSFFAWFYHRSDALFFVAISENSLVGYAIGAPIGYDRDLNLALFRTGVAGVLSHPWVLFDARVARNLRKRMMSLLRGRKQMAQTHILPGKGFSLVGIAVAERVKGTSVAKILIDKFEQTTWDLGYDFNRLSVHPENGRARRFYDKCGWELLDSKDSLYYFKRNKPQFTQGRVNPPMSQNQPQAAGKCDKEDAGIHLAEVARIRDEFRRRDHNASYNRLYSVFNSAALDALQSRERRLLKALSRVAQREFAKVRLLDIGCGSGCELLRQLSYGLDPANCAGIDLSEERITQAAKRLPPTLELKIGDVSSLPFKDETFDVVTQFTVFSSILTDVVRTKVASEVWRVLRPGGCFLSYDFWINPINEQTRPLTLREMRRYFPAAEIMGSRITLAPPLARRLAWFPPLLLGVLEALKVFNTHLFIVVRKSA